MFYDQKTEEVFRELNSSANGLSEEEVQIRIKQYGYNELRQEKKKSRLKIFLSQFNSFIIYILMAATIISAFLQEYVDAAVIFIILILNAVLGYIQEYRAEAAIEALKKMASLKATVLRNEKHFLIDSKHIVPGDIMVLETGEKIPADARLIEVNNLETQEAALTGESLPVIKTISVLKSDLNIGDRKNMVYSGTIITKGRGKALVTGTGMKTEIGKIAHLIQESKTELTPLQKKIEQLGKFLGILILIICAVVFAIGVFTESASVMDMFLAAVSLAVAAIPEGLPAVITISLALGVQRMVKKNALMRRLPVVETLGSVTVICTDKTGTLTKNEMTVKKIFINNKIIEVSGSGYEPTPEISEKTGDMIFKIGALCNNSKLVNENDKWYVIGDPTEGCLLTVARKAGLHEETLNQKHPRLHEIQFDGNRKRMTTIHKVENKRIAFIKGAPDVVLKLCKYIDINGKIRKINNKDKKNILKINDDFSKDALRVLGFAYKDVTKIKDWKKKEKEIEKDMVFVGMQAMIDPPREEVKIAIEKCKTAGIRVIMITGDYKGTAVAIAKELGIEGKAIDGSELDEINLDAEVEHIGIYARVNPEDKMKIVDALKKKGYIVAMTGDGVNDAPALKKADIGIAMGISGTDVAKEASAMILMDDNFASIVNAVEEGRNIFVNMKKFIGYMLSCNIAEVMVLFFAMLFAAPLGYLNDGKIILPLVAIQILWINLITDGLPALALGIDKADEEIMKKHPRNPKEHIISREMVFIIILIGLLITAATLYAFGYGLTESPEKARTIAMTTLVVLELIVGVSVVRALYDRKIFSTHLFKNFYLTLALIGSFILQIVLIYSPLNKIFKIVPLTINDWIQIAIVTALCYVIGKIIAYVVRKEVKN